MATTHDVPMLITSTTASCERRITPSWTISQLKAKLEPVTGIPISSQQLTLLLPDHRNVVIEAKDEDAVQVSAFELIAYAEINVGVVCCLQTCWNKLLFIGKPVNCDLHYLHLRERERRSVARTCAPRSLKVFLNLVPLCLSALIMAALTCLVSQKSSFSHPNKSIPPPPPRNGTFLFNFRLLSRLYPYHSKPLITPYLGRIPRSSLWPQSG